MSRHTPSPRTLESLGWSQVLEAYAQRCHTERGSAAARALPLAADAATARRHIELVSEARRLYDADAALPFAGISTIDTALGRAEKGGDLDAESLLAVARTAAGLTRLRRHVRTHAELAPRLVDEVAEMEDLGHVAEPILRCFDDRGGLADHASEALGPLRRRAARLHEELGERLRKLLDDPRLAPHLQDRFVTQREHRYVVPVRADARGSVEGIVHDASGSGQTLFIEPQSIVDLNNRLKIAEGDVVEEERRILRELSAIVREEVGLLRVAVESGTRLDLVAGAAGLARGLDAVAPELTGPGELHLPAARHPLMVLAKKPCVPNDVHLGGGEILILSGPNAGGKTVALKIAGLAALMARAGLHVVAGAGAKVPFYRVIRSDIGDEQSLERDLSTFSAHLLSLAEGLAEVTATGPGEALVLLDEVAVGTDPTQGAAIAQAVLEHLAVHGVQGVVTTHYEQLKALPPLDPRFRNGSMGYDLERLTPTFELHLGVPGASGALPLARRMGLPEPVVARAETLFGEGRAGIEALLADVTEERRRIVEEREELKKRLLEAEIAVRETDATRRRMLNEEKEQRRGAHGEAVAELRRARDELDRLRKRVRKMAGAVPDSALLDELTAAAGDLDRSSAKVRAHAPPVEKVDGERLSPEELVPGTAVRVTTLGADGTIVERPRGAKIAVQVGALRTQVAVEDLRRALSKRAKLKQEPPAPKMKAKARPAAGAVAALASPEELTFARTPDTTLDLRGARVDEAIASIDRFLDASYLAERDTVFIVHGHGTGALRDAIRRHLSEAGPVAKWRPGQPGGEGGDGVTVVWLG